MEDGRTGTKRGEKRGSFPSLRQGIGPVFGGKGASLRTQVWVGEGKGKVRGQHPPGRGKKGSILTDLFRKDGSHLTRYPGGACTKKGKKGGRPDFLLLEEIV